ncbi:MAG TPA: YcxB family protein [Kribbellaceae bacterium]|nr:YcxB family protein [Kribbellaceae bacterium]
MEDARPLELRWTPSPDDARETAKVVRKVCRAGLKQWVWVALFVVLAIVAVAIGSTSVAVIELLVAAFLARQIVMHPPRKARSFDKDPSNRLALSATVDSRNGVTITDGQQTQSIAWSEVERVVEAPALFVLFLTGTRDEGWIVLPKRAVADPAHVDLLRHLLLPAEAELAPPP